LVKQLNDLETAEFVWQADKITDTGPILRLEKDKLSKAERYAHPTEREIYSSGIAEEEFTAIVQEYLEKAYAGITAKRFWSWEEMREFSRL
jgi:hypothetical protein